MFLPLCSSFSSRWRLYHVSLSVLYCQLNESSYFIFQISDYHYSLSPPTSFKCQYKEMDTTFPTAQWKIYIPPPYLGYLPCQCFPWPIWVPIISFCVLISSLILNFSELFWLFEVDRSSELTLNNKLPLLSCLSIFFLVLFPGWTYCYWKLSSMFLFSSLF